MALGGLRGFVECSYDSSCLAILSYYYADAFILAAEDGGVLKSFVTCLIKDLIVGKIGLDLGCVAF